MASKAEQGKTQAPDQLTTTIDKVLHAPISRRKFLQRSIKLSAEAIGVATLINACSGSSKASEAPPSSISEVTPISTLSRTPEETPNFVPQETPTPPLSGESFLRAFSSLSDTTKIKMEGRSGIKTAKELAAFASSVWGEIITTTTVSRNSLHAIEFVLAAAEAQGINGKVNFSKIFSGLSLQLPRLTINKLPNGKDVETVIKAEPYNLTLRKGMHVTVLGIYGNDALVAFSDTVRKPDKQPTMYFANLSIKGDVSQDDTCSLQKLLSVNKASYNPSTRFLIYNQTGGKVQLRPLDKQLDTNIVRKTGSFFLDLDPLRTKVQKKAVPEAHPVVPLLPTQFTNDKVKQLSDGRVVAAKSDGKIDARARYSNRENSWVWATDKESLQDFTIRELADAKGQTVAVFFKMTNVEDSNYITAVECIANMITVAGELDPDRVFGTFTLKDWKRMLKNWSSIQTSLSKGELPEGFNYDWSGADKMVAFARREKMQIRVQHLLGWGINDPQSVIKGDFSSSELLKILEFMVKTRVIKYKGVVAEWEGASETASASLWGLPENKFWIDKFGTSIIDKVFVWARQADPHAKLSYTEDAILDGDANPDLVQTYFGILKHLKNNNIPVDQAVIENNLWIYAPPNKEHMIDVLRQIMSMGYKIGPGETSVLLVDQSPQRPKLVKVSDPLQAQADVYKTVLESYLAVGAEFGVADASDAVSWIASTGYPETKAMILDDQWDPKPAYFALVNVLKANLSKD